jgi:glycosyltransferase involved in cell wall biosynthesis
LAKISIHIATKNRKNDLDFTLGKVNRLLENDSVECVVIDDGSSDGTYGFVVENYPNVKIERNVVSKGLLYCRNKMLNETKAEYAISLDDDAHFVNDNALDIIFDHFEMNPNCGLIALRIYWGMILPTDRLTFEKSKRVQGYVGCGHVWRMDTWRAIPNYPEWFVFYGEENFASYHLFKNNWEVHYLPEVLVHHRVNLKARKNNKDYMFRLRHSLRSGWYLFFLFYPIKMIPRRMAYSIWMQFRIKVLKGDYKVVVAIFLALFDLILAFPKVLKCSNRFSEEELGAYQQLEATKIYWEP